MIFREINHALDGTVEIVDDRDFASVKAFQLASIRGEARRRILALAPEYRQMNAALGLLPPAEAAALKAHIDQVRTQSNTLEGQVEAVTWDGQESSRAAACDAVQAVIWPPAL